MLHIEVSAEQQNKHPPYTALLTFVKKSIPVLGIDLVIKKNTKNKQNKQHDV